MNAGRLNPTARSIAAFWRGCTRTGATEEVTLPLIVFLLSGNRQGLIVFFPVTDGRWHAGRCRSVRAICPCVQAAMLLRP
jgi:hypothetical protein